MKICCIISVTSLNTRLKLSANCCTMHIEGTSICPADIIQTSDIVNVYIGVFLLSYQCVHFIGVHKCSPIDINIELIFTYAVIRWDFFCLHITILGQLINQKGSLVAKVIRNSAIRLYCVNLFIQRHDFFCVRINLINAGFHLCICFILDFLQTGCHILHIIGKCFPQCYRLTANGAVIGISSKIA